jgi:flavin reductase (DIM6/NTAB) family NADH-FMN oxidoreductase RutF
MMAAEGARMAIDPELLRSVMRHWTTGVTILTSRHAGLAHGMTVNSFTSVSLEPPLVLASIEHDVRTHELIEASGVFAVSFLRAGQAWISDRFAGRETENTDRFDGLETFTAVTGAPVLRDNLAWLDCVVTAAHPAGNHTLFVAEVVAASAGHAGEHPPGAAGGSRHRPLLYFDRAYRELCDT